MSGYTYKFEAISTLRVSFDDFYVVEPAGANPHDIFDHLYMGRNGIWHIIFTAQDPIVLQVPQAVETIERSITHEDEPIQTSDDPDGWMFQHIPQFSAPNASFYNTEVYRPSTTRLDSSRRDSVSPTPSLASSYSHDVPDESFASRPLIRLGGSPSTPIPPSPSPSPSPSFTWPTATGPGFFYRFYEQEEMAVDITYLGRTVRLV
jgi:hypothetical protein